MYLLNYETIDGNGDVEKEFASEAAMRAHVDSLDGLLLWHVCYDENGEII